MVTRYVPVGRYRQLEKKAYPLAWLASDLLSIKTWAAQHQMSGITALLTKLPITLLEPGDPIERYRQDSGRMRMTLNDNEVIHFTPVLDYARAYAKKHGAQMQEVLSALVVKAFGPAPSRPAHIPHKVWQLWQLAPLTRNRAEPTIDEFYASAKATGLIE